MEEDTGVAQNKEVAQDKEEAQNMEHEEEEVVVPSAAGCDWEEATESDRGTEIGRRTRWVQVVGVQEVDGGLDPPWTRVVALAAVSCSGGEIVGIPSSFFLYDTRPCVYMYVWSTVL